MVQRRPTWDAEMPIPRLPGSPWISGSPSVAESIRPGLVFLLYRENHPVLLQDHPDLPPALSLFFRAPFDCWPPRPARTERWHGPECLRRCRSDPIKPGGCSYRLIKRRLVTWGKANQTIDTHSVLFSLRMRKNLREPPCASAPLVTAHSVKQTQSTNSVSEPVDGDRWICQHSQLAEKTSPTSTQDTTSL